MTSSAQTPVFNTFKIDRLTFHAKDCVDGVLINPKLPRAFDVTPNELRPASHHKWWYRPFILTETIEEMDEWYANRTDDYAEEQRQQWQEKSRPQWLARWPGGVQYTVRSLNGGAWDRSSWLGSFDNLDEALALASLHASGSRRSGLRPSMPMPPFFS